MRLILPPLLVFLTQFSSTASGRSAFPLPLLDGDDGVGDTSPSSLVEIWLSALFGTTEGVGTGLADEVDGNALLVARKSSP